MGRRSLKIFKIGALFRVGPVQRSMLEREEERKKGHKIYKIQYLAMKLIFYTQGDVLKLLSKIGVVRPLF